MNAEALTTIAPAIDKVLVDPLEVVTRHGVDQGRAEILAEEVSVDICTFMKDPLVRQGYRETRMVSNGYVTLSRLPVERADLSASMGTGLTAAVGVDLLNEAKGRVRVTTSGFALGDQGLGGAGGYRGRYCNVQLDPPSRTITFRYMAGYYQPWKYGNDNPPPVGAQGLPKIFAKSAHATIKERILGDSENVARRGSAQGTVTYLRQLEPLPATVRSNLLRWKEDPNHEFIEAEGT